MPLPALFFTIGPKTAESIDTHLTALKNKQQPPGKCFQERLAQQRKTLETITSAEYFSMLMETRQPTVIDTLYSENEVGWTPEELRILSSVAFHATDTKAFNDGDLSKRHEQRLALNNHETPLPVRMVFISGPMLNGGAKRHTPYDEVTLVENGQINENALFLHLNEKLLHVFLAQNTVASEKGEKCVINFPSLGGSHIFSGKYQQQIQNLLPKLLERFIKTHKESFTHIHTVNFDSGVGTGFEHEISDLRTKLPSILIAPPVVENITASAGHTIHFQISSFYRVPDTEQRAQLSFPYSISPQMILDEKLVLVKLLDWDPISFMGSSLFYNNHKVKDPKVRIDRDWRSHDSGVCTAATDLFEQLIEFKILQGSIASSSKFRYSVESGLQVLDDASQKGRTPIDLIQDEQLKLSVDEDIIWMVQKLPPNATYIDQPILETDASKVSSHPTTHLPLKQQEKPLPLGHSLFSHKQQQHLRKKPKSTLNLAEENGLTQPTTEFNKLLGEVKQALNEDASHLKRPK